MAGGERGGRAVSRSALSQDVPINGISEGQINAQLS